MALVPMMTRFRVVDLEKNEPFKNMLIELLFPLEVNQVPVVVEVWGRSTFMVLEGRDWTASFSSDMVLGQLSCLAKLALVFCRE